MRFCGAYLLPSKTCNQGKQIFLCVNAKNDLAGGNDSFSRPLWLHICNLAGHIAYMQKPYLVIPVSFRQRQDSRQNETTGNFHTKLAYLLNSG